MTFFYRCKQIIKKIFTSIDHPLSNSFYNYVFRIKKNQERKIWTSRVKKGQSNFVSIEDLTLWTTEWMQTISLDYDIIIGIPRCGLLVAAIIASKAGKALAATDTIVNGKYWNRRPPILIEQAKRALLVDDSLGSGETMRKHLKNIRAAYPHIEIDTASLITHSHTRHMVDYYYKIIPNPLIMEWELMDEPKKFDNIAISMEGVLCHNFQYNADDSEKKYHSWLKEAKPYLIPTYEIDTIISERSTEYRTETENWLKKHNVKYQKLIFSGITSSTDVRRCPLQNKLEQLNELKPHMFFEYSYESAQEIWQKTKIPTLSFEKMVLFPEQTKQCTSDHIDLETTPN